MSYLPGEYVDLSYLNQPVQASQKKSSFAENLQEVGSSYIFRQGKAFKKIPVVFVS